MKPLKRPTLFYGWVIVATSFFIALVGYGMRYSFSIFYVTILDEYGWSRATLAGAFSLALLTYGIGAIGIGAMVDKLGPRKVIPLGAILLTLGLAALSRASQLWHFYVFFGVLVTVGTCAVGNAPGIPVLSRWFMKRRGMAMGIFFAGAAGAPTLGAGIQYLISTFGWRDAYLVLAALAAVVIIPLALTLIRNKPQDMGLLPDGQLADGGNNSGNPGISPDALVIDRGWAATEWLVSRALRTYRFHAIFWLNFFIGVIVNVVYLHQGQHLVDVGYTPAFAAWIFTLIGMSQIVGNMAGFVSDRYGREFTYTIGIAGSIVAISLLILINDSSNIWLPYSYAIILGLFMGLTFPAAIATHGDVFLGKSFGLINGFFLAAFGIGSALGSYMGGYIFDKTGSYTIPFLLAIIAAVGACASMWIASPRKIRMVAGKARR